MTLPVWLSETADGVILRLYIQPGARKTEVVGQHGDALKIKLMAVPVEGKANQALLAFLAEQLLLPLRTITLLSGQSSRQKRIHIANTTAMQVQALF